MITYLHVYFTTFTFNLVVLELREYKSMPACIKYELVKKLGYVVDNPRFQTQNGQVIFLFSKTSGTHPTSYTMATGVFSHR
jgi:hypothetical protein